MSTWAIVVAAGSGTRFGERKQYLRLSGARVLDWALREPLTWCDGVVLVVPPDVVDDEEPEVTAVVAGGATRSESVRHGLVVVPAHVDVVVVHDAARPVPVPGVWERVLAAVDAGADAAVPAIPLTDSLRRVDGPAVDRTGLVSVQTPQGFRASVLRAAHATGADATDDASLVEAAGGRVVLVEGDPANLKITTPVDLSFAELLCR
jgi:2-C-methyl-D-erythritol 4-phosphate cytidylyltransferase